MAKYKILAAIKTGQYTGKFGPMDKYALSLQDEDGKTVGAELSQKPTTPIPSGEIEGDIEQSQYGPKFNKAKPAYNGAFGGSRGSADPTSKRQHSQEMALRYCELLHKITPMEKLNKESLKPLIDWFDTDAQNEPKSSSSEASEPQRQTVVDGREEIDIEDIDYE